MMAPRTQQRRSKCFVGSYAPSDGKPDIDESPDEAYVVAGGPSDGEESLDEAYVVAGGPSDDESDTDESLDEAYVVAGGRSRGKKPPAKKRSATKSAAKKASATKSAAKKRSATKSAAKKLPPVKEKRTSNGKSSTKRKSPPLSATDTKKRAMESRQPPPSKAASFLLTGEGPPPDSISSSWKKSSVQWTEHASASIKSVFEQDMLLGSIKGAAAAVSADLAVDVKNCQKWIKFGNGRTSTSNGGNSLGNIFDYREELPSLEPLFAAIDRFQVKTPNATPPEGWIHGNNSIISPTATNTHGKHRDRLQRSEKFVRDTFGVETKRVRIAVSATPPAGVHAGKIKETRYAFQGQDVLRFFGTEEFSFTMMGPRANGKEPFFGSEPGNAGDEERELALLGDDFTDHEDDDDEEEDSTDSPHMKHGVYNNAGALSIMLEATIEDGKVHEFYEAFSTCYDSYVPNHAPGSVRFEFPRAAVSYQEAKRDEKRLLAAKAFERGPLRLIQQFIEQRGHGAISSDVQCCADGPIDPRLLFLAHKIRVRHSVHQGRHLNRHIKAMLDRVGFVFNINLWIAERTVSIMEEYCQDGSDINTIPQQQVVRGYHLGRMITVWKCNGSKPGWMERPDLKRRLDAMGFDMSLNANEAKFAARCRQLKAWKLRHNGSNPGCGGKNDDRDQEEKSMYWFQWSTRSGERNFENMKNPKLRALFEDAYAIGH